MCYDPLRFILSFSVCHPPPFLSFTSTSLLGARVRTSALSFAPYALPSPLHLQSDPSPCDYCLSHASASTSTSAHVQGRRHAQGTRARGQEARARTYRGTRTGEPEGAGSGEPDSAGSRKPESVGSAPRAATNASGRARTGGTSVHVQERTQRRARRARTYRSACRGESEGAGSGPQAVPSASRRACGQVARARTYRSARSARVGEELKT